MIDRSHLGRELPPNTAVADAWRVRFFVKAIGEKESLEAGDGTLPPTFAFCLEMDRNDPFLELNLLGIPLERVLHGEQSFVYHVPIRVGDRITFASRVADIYEKKGGALEFVVIKTEGRKDDGTLAIEMRRTIVVRNS